MKILKFKGFVLDKNDNRNGSIETFLGEDGMLVQGVHNGTDIHVKPFIYNNREKIHTLKQVLTWYNRSKKKLGDYIGTRQV